MTLELINGDSFALLKTMGRVDAIITDPPYDFDGKLKSDLLLRFKMLSKGWIIIFHPPENPWPLDAGMQHCFWVKPISTKNTSKHYSRFVECISIYGHGYWDSSRHWSNYVNAFPDFVDGETGHPYEKPISLMRRLVLNHTQEGQVVLDPFMGSGTTGVACKLTGRGFIGIEKDALRHKEAVERIA